jgi:DNA-directed RNA polymerase subunit M/transcription elongation factor TFIIS
MVKKRSSKPPSKYHPMEVHGHATSEYGKFQVSDLRPSYRMADGTNEPMNGAAYIGHHSTRENFIRSQEMKQTQNPKCPKCGSRTAQAAGLSTRDTTIFKCVVCPGVTARDVNGKPFTPPMSTR